MGRAAKPWFDRQKNQWTAWFNGRRERLAVGRENKQAARQRLAELQVEAAKNPGVNSAKQTVASVIESYLEYESKGIAASTLASKQPYLQDFAEHHGWRAVDAAKPIHLTDWIHKHPSWKSDWTIATAIKIIQRAFNWAAQQKLIAANPFTGVTHPEGKAREPMTYDELRAILRATGSDYGTRRPTPAARFRQILMFCWFSGCRPCEAYRLRWEHIDRDRRLVILADHKTSRTRKGKSRPPRIIMLHPVVIKLLDRIRSWNQGEFVFTNFRGTPWDKNTLGTRVRRARDKAGAPKNKTLYGTRHAFGTRATTNKVEIKTVAELMGHASTRTTEHYIHLAKEFPHLAEAILAVNGRRPSV